MEDEQSQDACASYVLWLNPFFPAHHFYLQRLVHGCCAQCNGLREGVQLEWRLLALYTMNFLGCGWLLDAILMPYYVRSFNAPGPLTTGSCQKHPEALYAFSAL